MKSIYKLVFVGLALLMAVTSQAGNTIAFPQGIVLSGAAAYLGLENHQQSPYFKHPDFYNLSNTESLTILPHFKTYQQTTEYSCGPAALIMAAYYRGTALNELDVLAAIGNTPELAGSTAQLVDYLKDNGWQVRSSLTEPNVASLAFLKGQIKKNNPILVEWLDWAGHWQVVIGYDDMGTQQDEADDVLIVADPYDTSDHLQDGYGIVSADRFQSMWFNLNGLPEDQREKHWIIFNR